MAKTNKIQSNQELNINNSAQPKPKKKKKEIIHFLFPLLLALAIILGIWGYFIKTNKFGLGDIFRDKLRNIPVVRHVLPSTSDPEAAENMSDFQISIRYEELREEKNKLNEQIEEQQELIQELQVYKDEEEKRINQVKQQTEKNTQEKKEIDKDRKELDEQRLAFAEKVTNQDEEGFTEFFEKMDKDIAEQIYEKIIKENQADEEVKNYVKTFEGMEPANAAQILENMGLSNIDLVSNIMKLMKKQIAGEILANMDPVFAANLADIMAVEYNIYPEE